MVAVKSAVVANVLASVKVATTVELGSATPVLGVNRVAGSGGQRGVGDDGRPGDDGGRAINIGHRDRVGVGPLLGVGVGGVDGPDDTVGRADGGEVGGGQGLWRRAVAPVDHDRAGRGGVVGDGRGLVGVDEGPEQDGARRAPLNSGDLVAGRAGQRQGRQSRTAPGRWRCPRVTTTKSARRS